MNIQSWIILIVVAVLFVLAIIGDRRRHKSGSGCCSSSECTGDCANCACYCNVGNVEKTDKKNKNKGEKKAMKELTVFVYPGCPYCAQARKIFDKLFSDGGYSDIKLTFIDETEHPEISDKYDYNACPSIYYGDKKIYEAKPLRPESKAEKMIKQALDSVEQMEE